jgi:hypothetical protein
MDKAPAYGAGDSGFESQYGLFFFPRIVYFVFCISFFPFPGSGDSGLWLGSKIKLKNKKVQAVGFEPTPLSRLAPKASALTTRPNLHASTVPESQKKTVVVWYIFEKKDTLGGTWTRNPQIRSLVLYPLSHKGADKTVAFLEVVWTQITPKS